MLVTCPRCAATLSFPESNEVGSIDCPNPDCGAAIPLLPSGPSGERIGGRNSPEETDLIPFATQELTDPAPQFKRSRFPLIEVVLIVALIAVGIGFVVSRYVWRPTSDSPPAAVAAEMRSPLPNGWKEYRYDKYDFRAMFPSQPGRRDHSEPPSKLQFPNTREVLQSELRAGVMVEVLVYPIEPDLSNEERNRRIKVLRNHSLYIDGKTLSKPHVIEWCGLHSLEFSLKREGKKFAGTGRLLVTKRHCYYVSVKGDEHEPPEEIRGYAFDNFHLLSSQPTDRDAAAALVDLSARWEEHSFPEHRFKLRFTGEPVLRRTPVRENPKGSIVRSFAIYQSASGVDSPEIQVFVVEYHPDATRFDRAVETESIMQPMVADMKKQDKEPLEVTLDGQPAQQLRLSSPREDAIITFLTTETHTYAVSITTHNRPVSMAEQKAFFDSFHLLK